MKLAIIGSGISGLTTAKYLAGDHDITIFESGDRLGGHTNTVHADVDGVTNTRWHDYHGYVIDKRDGLTKDVLKKRHHVSPFFPIALTYEIWSEAPRDDLSFRMNLFQGSEEIFTAELSAQRSALDAKGLCRLLMRHPTQRVSLGIYAHAAQLKRRGARFVPDPKKLDLTSRDEMLT